MEKTVIVLAGEIGGDDLAEDIFKGDIYDKKYHLKEGGIFRSLHDMGEDLRTGFKVRLKKIPISQAFIEECEREDKNPYMQASGGALLFVALDIGLIYFLEEREIPYSVIGYLKENNDRLVYYDGVWKYLK